MEYGYYIDFICLEPSLTSKGLKEVCKKASIEHVTAITVAPSFVPIAVQELRNSSVLVNTVIGYPYGFDTIEAKLASAQKAYEDGVSEIKVTPNMSAIKEKSYDYLFLEIQKLQEILKRRALKLSIDIGLLNEEEIRELIKACNVLYINVIDIRCKDLSKEEVEEKINIIMEEKSEVLELELTREMEKKEELFHFLELGVNVVGIKKIIK